MRTFFADFETTGINHFGKCDNLPNQHTHVAIYYISGLDSYGFSIDEFIQEEWLHHDYIYFHNLNFDGEFLIEWLIKNKYVFDDRLHDLKSFTFMKSVRGIVYSLKIRIRKNCVITIKDSYKLIPLSIKRIGDYFNLPKDEIDYDVYNQLYECEDKLLFCKNNEKVKTYLKRDVDIISRFLNVIDIQHNVLPKTTIASYALSAFLSYPAYISKYCYLLNDEQWEFIRFAYFGGLTTFNQNIVGKLIEEKIYHYDVNSMYPSIMKNECLPYGKPLEELVSGDLKPFFFRIRIFEIFKITKKDFKMINHFQYKRGLKIHYLENKVFTEHYIVGYCDDEWEELLKTYHIEYFLHKTYWFKKKVIFKKFVKKWENLKIKYEKTNPNYLFTKLVQNSLYGKLGQRKYFLRQILDEEYNVVNTIEEKLNNSPIHIAVAITSLARVKLLRIIRANFDKFIYCDTDSIVGTFKLPQKWINDYEYGKWKLEYVYKRFKVLKQKCYLAELAKSGFRSAVSGLDKDTQKLLNYKNFYYGSIFKNTKLQMCKVRGGMVLKRIDFEIKERTM